MGYLHGEAVAHVDRDGAKDVSLRDGEGFELGKVGGDSGHRPRPAHEVGVRDLSKKGEWVGGLNRGERGGSKELLWVGIGWMGGLD